MMMISELQAYSRLEKVSLTLVAGALDQTQLTTLMQEMENSKIPEQKNGEIEISTKKQLIICEET